jgi:hypothetical protein
MNRKLAIIAGFILSAALMSNRCAQAGTARYAFKAGDRAVYEITVRAQFPTETKSVTGYVMLRPQSVDAGNGQCTLSFDWGVTQNLTTPKRGFPFSMGGSADWLFKDPPANAGTAGKQVVIDPAGAVVSTDVNPDDAQLEDAQGQAWRLPLQPLPPSGQSSWSTQRQLTLYYEETSGGMAAPLGFPAFAPRPPMARFGGRTTRVEVPANENVTYTASPPQGNLLTVQRHYEMNTLAKMEDSAIEHMHGDGQYVFDTQLGRVVSLQWNLTDDVQLNNLSATIPISVTAHLVTGEELAKMKAAADAAEAQRQAQLAKAQREHGTLIDNLQNLPDGMELTESLGLTEGGGSFIVASAERRPVIGFKIQVSEWFGHKCFRIFDPLYSKPQDPPDKDTVFLLARPGYAVGSVTINAGNGVNALCVRFMKITDKGLDPSDSYVSRWFGAKVGTAQTKLGGDGRFVYGIFGRKGLNIDALGLVMGTGSADDANSGVDDSTKK